MLEVMLRTIVMGALATAAALLFERGLAHLRLGTRHAWTFALLATLTLPIIPRLTEARVPQVVPVLAAPTVVIEATSQMESRVPVNALVLGWLVLSALVLGAYAMAFVQLLRARRSWRPAQLAREEVFLSERFGPAVFGFIAPRIVVPEWVRETSRAEQELIVLHEREHIRAGDQLQLLLAIVCTVLMPWNPFTWLQARRLRFTVETDCDQRVLAGAADHRTYASLLVTVGSRQSGLLLTPALAEQRNGLERRLSMLAGKLIRNRWKAAGMAALGVALTMMACETRLPGEPQQTRSASGQAAPRGDARLLRPVTEAVQVAPQFPEAGALIDKYYPPLLRAAGIGGQVVMRVNVEGPGKVTYRVVKSSGRKELDAAAVKVMDELHQLPLKVPAGAAPLAREFDVVLNFDPAAAPRLRAPSIEKPLLPTPSGDAPVADAPTLSTEGLQPTMKQAAVAADQQEGPGFAPYTKAPELKNREVISGALTKSYPQRLRDAGIGGTAQVWALVDESGKVVQTRVKASSGRTELDAAALQVVKTMEFTPAENKGKVVKVWIALPVVFKVQ